jgi:DNA repair protein RecO (recombination protein O)
MPGVTEALTTSPSDMNHRLTQAIILATTDHGESDRLITFLTETTGKLTGIAKGARRSRRRFAHGLEPCSRVEVRYRESRSYSLVWIEECKLLDAHAELRENLQRWGYAGLVLEIIKEMVPEKAQHEELFELLEHTLKRLATDPDSLNVLVLGLLRLFHRLGYLSQLDSCTHCQQPAQANTPWWLDLQRGILACSRHHPVGKGCLAVDLGTLVLLRETRRCPLDKLWRLKIRQEVKNGLLQGLLDLALHQLGRPLKSLKVLRQIDSH